MKQKNHKPILPKRLCEEPNENEGCLRDSRLRCWGPWED